MTGISTLFSDLQSSELSGVAYKNVSSKKSILIHFVRTGKSTLADLSNELKISIPKVGQLITELTEDGLVKDFGKIESVVGRRPNLYGLDSNAIFFVGVEIKTDHINIGLMDFQKNHIIKSKLYSFTLSNTPESLHAACDTIKSFIDGLAIETKKILGIGINLSGRINFKTGYSYSYFHFSETPLSEILHKELGIATYLENDSRAMAYGEFCNGLVKDEKNVLFINIDYGIGMGIMVNGQLYYGKSGFAGEFGHIPFFNNEIICQCGKKGCLETEASGSAIIRQFKERLDSGETSVITATGETPGKIELQDVIEAVLKDDMLAIEIVAEAGGKLGKAIALLMNIYNPELVIIGGSLADTKDYIYLPIKNSINKYSLSLVNNDTNLRLSKLGNMAGITGACLLVRDRLLTLL